jgi:hypothetical protein
MRYLKTPSDGSHVESHNLVYQGAVEYWQSGIPIGNGETDAVAYQKTGDSVEFRYGITRVGMADRRCPMQTEQKTHKDILRLWKDGNSKELDEWDRIENGHYMRHPYPNPRPAGALLIKPLDLKEGAEALKQDLSLRNAVLSQNMSGLGMECFVSKEHDCLSLKISGEGLISLAFAPFVDYPGKGTHWWDDSGNIDDEIVSRYEAAEYGIAGYFSFPGAEWCVAVLADHAELLPGEFPGSLRLKPSEMGQSMQVYLAAASDGDGAEHAAMALQKAAAARKTGYGRLRDGHMKDWHDFWKANCLLIQDPFLENLFYLEQYLLRCGLGGSRACGNMSPWHLGTQPWHGDMHANINAEMLWLAAFTINRAEFSDSYDSHFARGLEDARNETKRFWGLPGLAYPFASQGSLKPLHGGYWRYEIYVSAWIAQVFWERFRFTGDVGYLAGVCYPIQKEVLLFFENYMEKDGKGSYRFPLSKNVESQIGPDGWSRFAPDPLLDIVSLRQLLEAAATASEILGLDGEERAAWKDMLENLAPMPADGKRRMYVSYRGASPDMPVDHPMLLGALFPSGLRLNNTETEYAKNSLRHIFNATKREMEGFPFKKIKAWGDDLSNSWIAIASARLGLRETACAYIYDLLVLMQLKKNGLFSTRPSDVESRDRKVSLFNTCGGFMIALAEMFLQSFDGIVRVFPATPEGYTAAFAGFKAAGNFTVDAALDEGKLVYIKLHSGSGGIAEIKNEWGAVRVSGESGPIAVTGEKMIKLPTQKGKTYFIEPETAGKKEFEYRFETGKRDSARKWAGPRFLEKLPAGDEWIISLGQ